MTLSAFDKQKIKTPNVSGQFYSANPTQLSSDINKYFKEATVDSSKNNINIIIAPHAGYVYSGGVAAYSFKKVSQNQYKTIVILAPSHFYGFDGVSVWNEGGFQTPLGLIEVDEEFAKRLTDSDDKFTFDAKAFEKEHSLEVEIPFLQKTFTDFKIVPVVMGQPTFETLKKMAASLYNIIGKREDVLLVISTDMSHYHNDEYARKLDARTIEAVKGLKAEQIYKECAMRTMEMCGCIPVVTALLYAKKKGIEDVDVLKYATSADVSGDYERVVGYTSIVFYDNQSKKDSKLTDEVEVLNLEQKRKLIEIARKTIETFVRTGKTYSFEESDPRLKELEGAFVTLHKHGRLRGCIGNIIGQGPLCYTVRDVAISSATNDPRFKPLTEDELDEVEVEVSVLSKPRVIKDVDEIKMGVHGVIVSQGPFNRGLFLPQVATETGWSKEEFLSQLCAQKARLPADAWKDPKTKIEIFSAEVFSEKDVNL